MNASLSTLREVIVMTANYYGKTLSAPLLNMYIEDLEGLDPDAVIAAYKHYRRNPKNTHFPLPAQIRAMVQPEVDPESLARAIAERIIGAIPKFGYMQSAEARAYIGEVGWGIVQRQGGWSYLCGVDAPKLNPQTLQAQIRDAAKSALQYSREAMERALELPGKDDKPRELTSAGDVLSKLVAVPLKPGTVR